MNAAKSTAIYLRQIAAREKLWPGVENRHLWYRKERDGFATMPRTMPLIIHIMDFLSGKGFPVGQVYLDLWCRTLDEGFLQLNRSEEMAFHAGFSGQRAVRTWKDRMQRLEALSFIGLKAGPLGQMSFAILYNPYHVIKRAYIAGKLTETYWQSLVIRANEIAALDFDDLDDEGNFIPSPTAPPAPAIPAAIHTAPPPPPPTIV